MRPEGEPYLKLLDFGVARILPDAPSQAPAPLSVPTDTGAVVGTPRYVSPEGALVEKDIDARADLYSAALVLYLMLVGRGPFDHLRGEDSLRSAHATQDPEPPSRFAEGPVPPELDRAILKALRKNRAERFQTAEEFQETLERVGDWLRKPAGWLETTGLAPVSSSESERERAPTHLPRAAREEPPWIIDPSIQLPANWGASDRQTASSSTSDNESFTESGPRVRVARPISLQTADEGDTNVDRGAIASAASRPSRYGVTLVFLLALVVSTALMAAFVFAFGRPRP